MRRAPSMREEVRDLLDRIGGQPRRRLWRRPALGNRPMLWKELHTGGARGFARFIGFMLTVIGGGFLAYYTVLARHVGIYRDVGLSQLPEIRLHGLGKSVRVHDIPIPRRATNLLAGDSGSGGAAAASMTSEHEEDTWVSLTATDLTGHEIVFAKMLGAIKRGRLFGAVIILLAMTGVVVGPNSVLSIPLLILAMAIYGWAAAALGVWISLQLRSTWRAQFLTMACLLLINVLGQGLLNLLSRFGFAPQLWPGFTPHEISKLLLDRRFIERLSVAQWPRHWSILTVDESPVWQVAFSVVSLLAYAALASLLTWHSLFRYEIVAGGLAVLAKTTPANLTHLKDQNVPPPTKQPQVVDAIA